MSPASRALRVQIGAAIGRAGWTETARRSGLRRETLHKSFGPNASHSPRLETVDAVVEALGLRLSLTRGVST